MKFIIKRIITAIITMFIVSALCFFAFSVIPGDPAISMAGANAPMEYVEMLREEMGLNRNIFARYFDWLFKFISGDAGLSFRYKIPVTNLLKERFPVTAALSLISIIFILLITAPASLLTVKRESGFLDRITNIFTAAGMSAPNFFIGLVFIWFFGLILNLFQPGNYTDYKESAAGFIGSLCFPALAIALPSSCALIKFLRTSLFTELKSDYVRAAKIKGAGFLRILTRHVLKNAAIPAVTMFGMIIAEVLSGSVIIEQVFSVPGIGRLLISSISSRDYPVIQALMAYISFIIVAANTLADITIMVIDPRIKTSVIAEEAAK